MAIEDLTSDQVAILRFLRKNPTATFRDIEKSRLGNNPWLKSYLQTFHPKKTELVTEEMVRSHAPTNVASEAPPKIKDILARCVIKDIAWESPDQNIFQDKPQRVFALCLPEAQLADVFSYLGPAAVQFLSGYGEKARMSGHPTVPGHVVISWVRYTKMDDGTLWVHETQTDLFWAVGARHITQTDAQAAYRLGGPYDKAPNMYIRDLIKQRATEHDKEFLALELVTLKIFLRKHEDDKVIFPTMSYRLDHYPADLFGDKAAPAGIFNEVPRRLRFEKADVSSLGFEAPDGEVWLHASVQELPADNDLHERIAKALRWTLHEVHTLSLASLRDLVRPVDQKLADEISDVIKTGGLIRATGQAAARVEALARKLSTKA